MELITAQDGKLAIHLDGLSEEANKRKEKVEALAVTQGNVRSVEDIRTDNNAFIKGVKENIEEAKEKYLEPFTALEKQALEAIKPLEIANKEFSNKILEAKKAKKLSEMEEYYRSLIAPKDDGSFPYGEMPSFDEVAQGIPTSLAKDRLKEAIKEKLESYQKTAVDVTLIGSQANIEKMKAYARLLNVDWGEN